MNPAQKAEQLEKTPIIVERRKIDTSRSNTPHGHRVLDRFVSSFFRVRLDLGPYTKQVRHSLFRRSGTSICPSETSEQISVPVVPVQITLAVSVSHPDIAIPIKVIVKQSDCGRRADAAFVDWQIGSADRLHDLPIVI